MRAAYLVPVVTLLASGVARAYDFEIAAQTVGQGYQLRWFRFSEPDRVLNRRRFTQTLSLDIWNILEPPYDAGHPDAPRPAAFDLYFTSSLRFDHYFGGFTRGETQYLISETMATRQAALTAVPELQNGDLALDILYAYVGGRRIGGVLDFQLGRQLFVDDLEWLAFDGLHARVRTPWRFSVEALGGLVVRDSSPVAAATHEPDGTGSSQCAVFSADSATFVAEPDDRCDQRQQLMPTFGLALATDGLRALQARISYRRALSRSVAGLYAGGAALPSWGVDHEGISASLRGNLLEGGIVPWAAARWNLLLALVDEAHAGVRLGWQTFSLTPEMLYSFPAFDGDSIFNVFSTEPYWDFRITADVWPERGRLRGYARGFVRRFVNSDQAELAPGQRIDTRAEAIGLGAGARYAVRGRGSGRLDLFYEDGFGGLRAGGDVSGSYRLGARISGEGRLSLIRFADDTLPNLEATSLGLQAGGVWALADGVAIHLLVEDNNNRFYSNQLRVVAVLDLAFQPEH